MKVLQGIASLSLAVGGLVCSADHAEASPVPLDVRSRSLSEGNRWAGAQHRARAEGDWASRRAKARQSLSGKFLRTNLPVASVDLVSQPSGGQGNTATVRLGGLTVLADTNLTGSRSWPIHQLTVWSGSASWSWGWIGIRLHASAGAGAQFGCTFATSPQMVRLEGAVQTFGNGVGGVSVDVLWGAADVDCSATVNFFNSTLQTSVTARQSGVTFGPTALEVILWELRIRARARILHQTLASKTFVHETGPSQILHL